MDPFPNLASGAIIYSHLLPVDIAIDNRESKIENRLSWSEQTIGLCPECLRPAPATLEIAEGRVWMRRCCPRHGQTRALIASDAHEYLRLREYVSPRVGGCCGGDELCASAGPPVCVLLLEVTDACNLRCPTCYADARGHTFMPVEEARRRLDRFFREQPRLDVLMLSGGEPTIHPQFGGLLEAALAYPINRVLVNTNGLRLNQDPELVELLREHRGRIELYFSLGGLRREVHERLYGVDLRKQKLAALDRTAEAGVFVTLVPTVERGVNEEEIGELFRFGLSCDNVTGLTYQPVMSAGRYEHDFAPERRMTLTDVLQELERQTDGMLRSSDFVGLPCSHPDCCALTYGLLDAERTTIQPLPRHLDVGRYLDLFADRISFSGLVGSAVRRVWSDMVYLRARHTLRDLAALFSLAGFREVMPLIGRPDELGRRVFRVVVKPFMDAHTYDHQRIDQCCTKILDETGQAVSFCEYNVLRRGRPSRRASIPLSPVVRGATTSTFNLKPSTSPPVIPPVGF